jgi:hypothetical protein
MEAARVLWIQEPTMSSPKPGSKIYHRGSDRLFESVENAVRYVMETLTAYERSTAMIQTDSRTIHLPDIEAMHAHMKAAGGQDYGGS